MPEHGRVILAAVMAAAFFGRSFAGEGHSRTERRFTPLSSLSSSDYWPATIVMKISPRLRAACRTESVEIPSLRAELERLRGSAVRMFPRATVPGAVLSSSGRPPVDLTTVYRVRYEADVALGEAIDRLAALGVADYVEPLFIPKVAFTPNDPLATVENSYHLYRIGAASQSGQSGWDVSSGSSSVWIGVVDTGTELSHPDLVHQIAVNAADPIDGIDNDLDGYVDNYRGWDLAMNDNDPTWQGDAHGVHTSGCAAAQVSNFIGVAGVGYKSRFFPVKVADATGQLVAAYEGIVYAADHGAKVILCPWSGIAGGAFGQEIVDYATNNRDALVVAAAGNGGGYFPYFPAAYDGVLSVAATDQSDLAGLTSFHSSVDLTCPGNGINSTWTGGTYAVRTGTSGAAAVAAGAAAIVRARYPSYSALQAGERLKSTADDIYEYGDNQALVGMLGTGRLNLFRALTESPSPSVVWENMVITDHGDNVFERGDTIEIWGDFRNYLAPVGGVTMTLSIFWNGPLTVLDGSTSVGALGTLQSASTASDPFRFHVNSDPSKNSPVFLLFEITAGSTTRWLLVDFVMGADRIDLKVNDISTTITSVGQIGYRQDTSDLRRGLGFRYRNSLSLLTEASLMVGFSSGRVSDRAIIGPYWFSRDFESVRTVQRTPGDPVSDFDVEGAFDDSGSATPLPVFVQHRAHAWTAAPDRRYVVVEYLISNAGAESMKGLRAGLLVDWSLGGYPSFDRIAEDSSRRMGYAYRVGPSAPYVGVKLLSSSGAFGHYAIDNVVGGGGGVDPQTGGFDDLEKSITLSTNRSQAGSALAGGNEVLHVVSSGPFGVAPSEAVAVAFALIAGDSLADLQASADAAQARYDAEVPLHVVASSAGIGGSINPAGTFRIPQGFDLTFTIEPENGYAILDVIVDGSSRGPLGSITLEEISSSRVVQALFRPVVGAVPESQAEGAPLMVFRSPVAGPDEISLSWGDSCGGGQADFAIFRGDLGGWYGHSPLLSCTTGGGFSVSDLQVPGDSYLLVVPVSVEREGSYGRSSAGAEIPQGSPPCRELRETTGCD